MSLWLPETARREHTAELQRMFEDGTQAVLEEWNRVLYQIDPDLRMVRAHENAHAPGLKPGYFHVLRPNQAGPPFVYPVEGPDGEFREPGSWLLDELRASDLWNAEANRDRVRRLEELDRQKQRRREREREERHDEINERWKAAANPGVSFSNAGPWRYRAGAPKGA